MTQFKLNDFDTGGEKSLTASVVNLVCAGWSLRRIQKYLKLKSHQQVAYHRDKAVKQRILTHSPEGWVLVENNHSIVSRASQGCQKNSALGGAGVKSVNTRQCSLVAGRGSGERVDCPSYSPVQRWGKHAVSGVFPIRRVGDWKGVEALCDRVVLLKPAQFVFKSGDVTLTVRKRSVKVNVYNLKGSKLSVVLEEARVVAGVALADFMVSYGFELGQGEFRASNADWVLSKELSKPFLRFKPDLADASHPEQVEVDQDAQGEIESLLNGSLRREIKASLAFLGESVSKLSGYEIDVTLKLEDIVARLERIEGKL